MVDDEKILQNVEMDLAQEEEERIKEWNREQERMKLRVAWEQKSEKAMVLLDELGYDWDLETLRGSWVKKVSNISS